MCICPVAYKGMRWLFASLLPFNIFFLLKYPLAWFIKNIITMEDNNSSFHLLFKKQHTDFWEVPDCSFFGEFLQFRCLCAVFNRLDWIDTRPNTSGPLSNFTITTTIITTTTKLYQYHLAFLYLRSTCMVSNHKTAIAWIDVVNWVNFQMLSNVILTNYIW